MPPHNSIAPNVVSQLELKIYNNDQYFQIFYYHHNFFEVN